MNEGPLSNALGLRGNPAAAEEILVAREIALCRLTKTPVHIAHISTEVALEHVLRAKEAGLPVTAEVTPHHLTLSDGAVSTYDTCCKMAPPLRSERDVQAVRKALASGLIDLIATDHAPHGLIDKAVEFDQAANGIIGLQSALPLTLKLVHDGIMTPKRWVEALTIAPAKLLSLPYGRLALGSPADVTVLDPEFSWKLTSEEIRSKSHNSPFLNWTLKGRVRATVVEGRVVYSTDGGAHA
jgi:dihydroorotase